ncbi:MAG TPA: S8 family serine peptidase, partial [Xanthobacteraceae bacterium]
SKASGAVTSTGPSSTLGGLVGVNGGTISGSTASGPVTGTSQSYLGGLVGINIGSIQSITIDSIQYNSFSTSTVTGTGSQNYAGGAVGLNFGLIDPTTSSGNVSSGANSVVGGFAGGNGAFSNFSAGQLPNSTFPLGTISADSTATGTASGGTGSTVGAQIGLNYPISGLPTYSNPIINNCNNAVCTVLVNGTLFDPNAGNSPLPPPPPPPPPPPAVTQAQVIQNLIQNITLASVTLGDVVNTLPLDQPPRTGPGSAPGPSAGGLPPQFGARFFVPPPLGETRFVQDQVVLQIPNNIPPALLQSVLASLGLSIMASQNMGLLGVTSYQVHIDNGQSITAAIQALALKQIVAGAQANYTYIAMQDLAQDPNLAGLTQGEGDAAQYAIGKLGLVDIHRTLKGGNISVAVIDSQIDVKHPDLDGDIAEQFDAVGAADQPHSHGTGMAGAIASHRRLMGIAPAARIYAVHAFSSGASSAESTTFNILKGLEWASEKGVRVINMSFAGPRDPSMERALKSAHDRGIVLIAAAGNAGPKSPPLFPGADPNVIAVTATDVNDKLFSGANRGKYVAVAAPGVDILVPAPDNTYQLTTGTSVASAEVSGIAALLLERNPNLGPEDIRKVLTSSARRLGKNDRDDDFGSGLVDPGKAIQTAGDFKSTDIATGAVPARPAPATRPPAPPPAVQPPALTASRPGAPRPAH